MGKIFSLAVAALLLLVVGLGVGLKLNKRSTSPHAATEEPFTKSRPNPVSREKAAEKEVIRELLSSLKDPDSAKIKITRVALDRVPPPGGGDVVCGRVNAKNSYGAYVGERDFYGETLLLSSGSHQTFVHLLRDEDYKCTNYESFGSERCQYTSRAKEFLDWCSS